MTHVIRLSATGLAIEGDDVAHRLLAFLDSIPRGVGQVMFQNNSYAGLLFVAGVACNSLLFAAGLLVGTAVSTLAAMALGADRAAARAGLYGFNGGLVAIALLYFLEPDALTWACVILAAAASSLVMAAFLALLDAVRLPALTAPFVATSLCFFLATARFGRLQLTGELPTAGLPQAATVEGVVTATTVGRGLLAGVGQVFLQENIVTGLVFAAGLLVASRLAFAAALAGSLTGLLVAWGMGAAEPAIRAGAYGFNSALVAIALAGVVLAPGRGTFGYALLGAAAAPFVAAASAAALAPFGLPVLTLPFVLTTWIFLLASRMLPGAGRPPA